MQWVAKQSAARSGRPVQKDEFKGIPSPTAMMGARAHQEKQTAHHEAWWERETQHENRRHIVRRGGGEYPSTKRLYSKPRAVSDDQWRTQARESKARISKA